MKKTSKKVAVVKLKGSDKFIAPYTMTVREIADSLFETHITIQDAFSEDEDIKLRVLPVTKKAILVALTEKLCLAYVKQDLADTIDCERDERRFEYRENTNAFFLYKLKLISKAVYETYNVFYY